MNTEILIDVHDRGYLLELSRSATDRWSRRSSPTWPRSVLDCRTVRMLWILRAALESAAARRSCRPPLPRSLWGLNQSRRRGFRVHLQREAPRRAAPKSTADRWTLGPLLLRAGCGRSFGDHRHLQRTTPAGYSKQPPKALRRADDARAFSANPICCELTPLPHRACPTPSLLLVVNLTLSRSVGAQ